MEHKIDVSMTFMDLEGQPLALLLVEDDKTVHVVNGLVSRTEEHVLCCVEGDVELQDEWQPRIEVVPEEVRSVVGAPFLIRLSLGPLPFGASSAQFRKIGLRLP